MDYKSELTELWHTLDDLDRDMYHTRQNIINSRGDGNDTADAYETGYSAGYEDASDEFEEEVRQMRRTLGEIMERVNKLRVYGHGGGPTEGQLPMFTEEL